MNNINFTLNKKLPIGTSAFEWYTKLVNAILVFVPNNSRCVIVGEENAHLFRYCDNFISNKGACDTTKQYLLGTVGKLSIYVDKYMGSEIAYEVRHSKEDFENCTDTGWIAGRIIMEENNDR